MMRSRPERVNGHIGTETRAQTPTGGSSREFSAMGGTLTEQRRVNDEGLRIVKFCCTGRTVWIGSISDGTVPESHG